MSPLPDRSIPYVVLDLDLRIVTATDEYVRTTLLWNEGITGRHVFDVFPDNPENFEADGVRQLHASLQAVLLNGQPHHMPEQRYDIRDHVQGGAWVEKYWLFANAPVFAEPDQTISHLVHQVQDVTDAVQLRQWVDERMRSVEEQRATLEQMLQDLTGEVCTLRAARDLLALGHSPRDSTAIGALRSALGAPETSRYLRAGESVPASGTYRAFHIHDCNPAASRIYRKEGDTFRACPRCKEEGTYYRLLKKADRR